MWGLRRTRQVALYKRTDPEPIKDIQKALPILQGKCEHSNYQLLVTTKVLYKLNTPDRLMKWSMELEQLEIIYQP